MARILAARSKRTCPGVLADLPARLFFPPRVEGRLTHTELAAELGHHGALLGLAQGLGDLLLRVTRLLLADPPSLRGQHLGRILNFELIQFFGLRSWLPASLDLAGQVGLRTCEARALGEAWKRYSDMGVAEPRQVRVGKSSSATAFVPSRGCNMKTRCGQPLSPAVEQI